MLFSSAFPLYPDANQREAAWADPKDNEAQDKTEFTKDVDKAYKSYMDSGDLYTADEQEGRGRGPVAEEMRRKLNAESERLRARLRQELAELRERLSPHPASHPASGALGDLRQRLAPLTQQLRSSLSGNVQELCGQLSLYIQGLERAEAQAQAGPPVYREAFHGMSQTLENGGIKLDDIIGDFQSKTGKLANAVEEEQSGRTWREMRSRLAQEVSSARMQAQSRWGVLNAELGALLLVTSPPLKTTEVTANVDEFCQSAALQNQVFLARLERVFLGLEEEREASAALSSPSDPSQPGSLLQEDFSAKFSALIQDILHSVQ
ncbi:Apolipoprotein A-IV [Merluccius polli]|uniref:Apolipoprotein A-IV n=1 Tax=Merluccius polli TaxID=89951 RepID=A0AA47MUN9_MERPO|nr:Apolipoprotein A-IV [Merluccius polli]